MSMKNTIEEVNRIANINKLECFLNLCEDSIMAGLYKGKNLLNASDVLETFKIARKYLNDIK